MLTNFFYNLLVTITAIVPGHYVWVSIVIITVLIRLVFLKPSISMTKMQHKQKSLQKHVEKIKETHKEDKKAEQAATLELYKKEGINPLSSCLPMIIQLIVLIGFYRIFTNVGLGPIKTELLYSFTPHLDALNSSFFGLDLSWKVMDLVKLGGWSRLALLFPLLAGATQFIQALQTKALQPKQGSGKTDSFQNALNSQFTYLFPIMTAYISYTLSSALSIYWIVQTLIMIVQQKYIMAKLEPIVADVNEGVAAQLSTPQITKKGGVVVEVRQKSKE